MTVSGSVDPSKLIKKLRKAGKSAELLPPKGGSNNNGKNNNNNILNDQLQKLQLDQSGKGQKQKDNGKPQKGESGGGKDQKVEKLLKDMNLPPLKGQNVPSQKEQIKNVKFSLPEDFDDESDFDDLDDDEFDDYDDDDLDDEDDFDDEFDMKAVSDKKGNDKKGDGGGNGGKKGSDEPKNGKNGDKNNGKKGGEKNIEGLTMGKGPKMMSQGFNGGPVGGIPLATAVQGVPTGMAAAMPANLSQQQQYMAMMRQQQQQQQQQQMMMNRPTVYGQSMGYVPAAYPAYVEPYTNYFSDENTNGSCSIM